MPFWGGNCSPRSVPILNLMFQTNEMRTSSELIFNCFGFIGVYCLLLLYRRHFVSEKCASIFARVRNLSGGKRSADGTLGNENFVRVQAEKN